MPDMLEIVSTDAEYGSSGPFGLIEACRSGRKATVVKYTDVTFVL
jgi:hypothetical protein